MRSRKLALRVSGTIFGIIALVHLARLITGVSVTVAGNQVPLWMNLSGGLATGLLCVWMWSLTLSAGSCSDN